MKASWKETMSKSITLPSGNTAVLRDPSTLRVKDRKKVVAAANGQEGLLQAMSMTDGLIAVLVESWSFDLIIPSIHIASLDELTMPDYDALAAEAAKAQSSIFTDFSETPANQQNPDSPLGELNA
jgi:hypothetical protein